jgi:hypothetical protein
MKYVFITLGVIVGLVVLGFLALVVNMILGSARQRKQMAARLAPVMDPIKGGQIPDPDAIFEFAANPQTRNGFFLALKDAGKAEYFPSEFLNRKAFAESNLVNWLCHPNELKSAPDEIQLVKVVTIPTTEVGDVEWYLFKYRTRPPHWAADKGWMAGVAGPYPKTADPSLVVDAPGTFSEMDPIASKPPDEHVRDIHEAAVGRGALDDVKKMIQA